MISLELLAPARNKDIGIAAIGCGADAVYIAGPAFGARKDAGNSVDDIRDLCEYAHKFGARVFVTLNTILMEDELASAQKLLTQLEDAGADAFIVQDLAILKFKSRIPLHASTQCSIRTPERARFLESLGFSRVVMERQTSLEQIKAVRESISCEIEYFVHGALCVCYSGQCYLSEAIDRRSANRGACIQACRSLYDLIDDKGKTLLKNKAILSLKDYNLIDRLEDLASSGVASFKIEGRLKNASYVRNVVRAYSIELDKLVSRFPEQYRRASFGKVEGGFKPSLEKTFNRGYTELFIEGKRGQWSSMDAPKSMGEQIGSVKNVRRIQHGNIAIDVQLKPGISLKNGDGFAFSAKDSIIGFRADVCQGNTIFCKEVSAIKPGIKLFRNISAEFEKRLDADMPERLIDVNATITFEGKENDYRISLRCTSEDGRQTETTIVTDGSKAENLQRMESMISSQISKKTGVYSFTLAGLFNNTMDGTLPFMAASMLNNLRRQASESLDALDFHKIELDKGLIDASVKGPKNVTYKQNVSNTLSASVYENRESEIDEQAYEITHRKGAELMRMKYCIRHELGLCPKLGGSSSGKLTLINNGRRFALGFDCKACEMTVKEEI